MLEQMTEPRYAFDEKDYRVEQEEKMIIRCDKCKDFHKKGECPKLKQGDEDQ